MPNMEQKDWSDFAEGEPDKDGWRTIESAPRDGTIILIGDCKYSGPPAVAAYYVSGSGYAKHPWVFLSPLPTDSIGWMEDNHSSGGYGPTHWQPLPAPPEPGNE